MRKGEKQSKKKRAIKVKSFLEDSQINFHSSYNLKSVTNCHELIWDKDDQSFLLCYKK